MKSLKYIYNVFAWINHSDTSGTGSCTPFSVQDVATVHSATLMTNKVNKYTKVNHALMMKIFVKFLKS